MAKTTAHRPSQSHLEWVRNSKGEKVRNTAYNPSSKKKGAPKRNLVNDVFHGGRERVEKKISPGTARNYITSGEHDGYGSTRIYGVIGTGETAGQIVPIKSTYHLERFTYSDITIKGPADDIDYVTEQYRGADEPEDS